MFTRRHVFSLCLSALLAGCGTAPTSTPTTPTTAAPLTSTPPIVFVHGNGDSAALWQTTIWRFESNGWPRDHLHAINVPYPLARDDDSKPQAGRTSTAEHMAYLKVEVDKVLQSTGAKQVVLMANSRGGYAVRNYIQNGSGAASVSHAILGGTPNHGVWAIPGFREGNEFAGTGPFLKALNAAKNAAGDEVTGPKGNERTPGVRWATIRSDNNDKFAQPDGLWIGQKGTATFVTYAGPELKGATNIVIPRIDHRETSFSPAAFAASYRFITGQAPRTLTIEPESRITLSGQITGLGVKSDDPASGNFVNNLAVPGALLEVYPIDQKTAERLSQPGYRKTVGPSGLWGPFDAQSGSHYEFVVTAPGYATTHIYRSPFTRSSSVVHLRAERMADADKDAVAGKGAVVTLSRPRGYFDLQRDTLNFDNQKSAPGLPATGAGISTSKIKFPDVPNRPISASFNGETAIGRAWPAAENQVSILEITN
jgi:triacylglycerol lipase